MFLYVVKVQMPFQSGVYKNLGREVGAVTAVATALCLYNMATGTYTDLSGAEHAGALSGVLPKLAIPLQVFTLTSPSLGLLLGEFHSSPSSCSWSFRNRLA